MDTTAQNDPGDRRARSGGDPAQRAYGVIGVIGGSGGAGASSFAAALAAVAGDSATARSPRRRRTPAGPRATSFLVDLDPSGGGLDVALGAEGVAGARWSGLHAGGGRLDPGQLLDGLPRWHGIPFLACDGHVPPAAGAVRSVIRSGREFGPVVLDLGRSATPARGAALEMLPALVIVVAAEIRAVTAAAAVQAAIAEEGFTGVARLVVRTDDAVIGSGRIAEVLDLALVGSMGADPGLRSGRDRGIDPRRLRRRTRALARDVIEWATSVPDRPAELFAPGHVGRTRADERPRAVGRIGPAGDEVVPAEAVA